MSEGARSPCLRPSRRVFLSAAALTAWSFAGPTPLQAKGLSLPDNRIGGDAALARLMQGNARFMSGRVRQRKLVSERQALTQGQRPFAAILGCADSRVAPELAFDQSLGDLFVVRLAGNFANDDAIASLEYAVKFLEVPLIMVLGHSHCGAIGATLKVINDNAVLPGYLPSLAESIRPAAEAASRRHPTNLMAATTAENVRQTVARLSTQSPILAPMREREQVSVVGAVYDLSSGKVQLL